MAETKTGIRTAMVGLIGTVVGVLGTIVVGSFGYFNKDRELDIQMVNVGLSILRGEATGDKDTLQARRFALRVLRKYADIEIPSGEFDDWAKKGWTPYKPIRSADEVLHDGLIDEISRVSGHLSLIPVRPIPSDDLDLPMGTVTKDDQDHPTATPPQE